MNPCSMSVIFKWHKRFRNGRKSTEDDSRDDRHYVVKMTIKDKVDDIIYINHKNVNQTWCFEATEFKFYRNDVETLCEHIRFSWHFDSVANKAGKADRNCEY